MEIPIDSQNFTRLIVATSKLRVSLEDEVRVEELPTAYLISADLEVPGIWALHVCEVLFDEVLGDQSHQATNLEDEVHGKILVSLWSDCGKFENICVQGELGNMMSLVST